MQLHFHLPTDKAVKQELLSRTARDSLLSLQQQHTQTTQTTFLQAAATSSSLAPMHTIKKTCTPHLFQEKAPGLPPSHCSVAHPRLLGPFSKNKVCPLNLTCKQEAPTHQATLLASPLPLQALPAPAPYQHTSLRVAAGPCHATVKSSCTQESKPWTGNPVTPCNPTPPALHTKKHALRGSPSAPGTSRPRALLGS